MCGSTCFGCLPSHHQEHTTALGTSGFTVGEWLLERCWSWSARPRPTMLQPPLSNGKTRVSWCSCLLLMMGGETPETCWAAHKRQVINFRSCCILLVDLFELYDDARSCKHQIEFKISFQCYYLLLTYILCYLLWVENFFAVSPMMKNIVNKTFIDTELYHIL
jgi:hypothetical protein